MVEGAQPGEAMRAPTLTFKQARKLRRDMSLPEVILWEHLRRGGLSGMHFRRQHPAGPYVLDFYCAASRLAIEVDGAAHDLPGQCTTMSVGTHGSPIGASERCASPRATYSMSGRSKV
jgi:hypothetical protein